MSNDTVSNLRNPAYRHVHGYEGAEPTYVEEVLDGDVIQVDRFATSPSTYFLLAEHGSDWTRVRMTREQLLAMAREIVAKLEG